MSPRVVIGAPVFNRAAYVGQAIESLLSQTYSDLALVVIDDRSDDETAAICAEYARSDDRVTVHVNERRLGMLHNTRKAFDLPRELFPGAELWALGSDHDLWEPLWLETLVTLLDEDPKAVLAYPHTQRVDELGKPYPRAKGWDFETRGERDPHRRVRRAIRGMAAGDMIYGLFRVGALERVGSYRGVLIPDRLLLAELALAGEFVQAPEVLWRRRFRGLADLDRQRKGFWPEGPPRYSGLPWWLQHAALIGWDYAVRGKGRPHGLGRAAGGRLAAEYLGTSLRHRAWRRWRRRKNRILNARNAALGPPVRAALSRPAVRHAVEARVIPALDSAEETLVRLTDSAEPGS